MAPIRMVFFLLKIIYMLNMKLKYLLVVCILFFTAVINAQAWEWEGSMEHSLLEKINNARTNLSQVLSAKNSDNLTLLACYPELTDYINEGLNPLRPDTRLFKSAATRAIELFHDGYSSVNVSDKAALDDRFIQANFPSEKSEEVVGIVLFLNYLPKEKAIEALWDRILSNEINCEGQANAIIFNPLFTEIGLSVQSGVMEINGVKFNSYIAVCDFGKDMVDATEKDMLLHINQIRLNNGNESSAEEDIAITQGESLPPFSFDNSLFKIAKQISEDIVLDIYSREEYISSDVLKKRLTEIDFETEFVSGYNKIWITIDQKTDEEVKEYFIEQLSDTISNPHESGLVESGLAIDQSIVLNTTYTEAGISIVTEKTVLDEQEYYIHAMTIVAALPLENSERLVCTGFLSGTDPEEVLVKIIGMEIEQYLFTGESGEFSVELDPGDYSFTVLSRNDALPVISETKVTLFDENVFIILEGQN